jgi:hypothetical protein
MRRVGVTRPFDLDGRLQEIGWNPTCGRNNKACVSQTRGQKGAALKPHAELRACSGAVLSLVIRDQWLMVIILPK